MIKVQNSIATREPLPEFLQGLAAESLLDLSWTDPSLGVHDCAWWPEERATVEVGQDQVVDGEVLELDVERRVVISRPQVRGKTQAEVDAQAAAKQARRDEISAQIAALQAELSSLA